MIITRGAYDVGIITKSITALYEHTYRIGKVIKEKDDQDLSNAVLKIILFPNSGQPQFHPSLKDMVTSFRLIQQPINMRGYISKLHTEV